MENKWGRNMAIDMLRGLTMALMIFVNDFWKVHGVPQWMEHAAPGVDFIGLSDVVFPLFLFAVGMSIPYAVENRYRKGFSAESTLGHILLRAFSLMIMGCVIGNASQRLPQDFGLYKIGFYWLAMVVAFVCIWNNYRQGVQKWRKWFYAALRLFGVAVLLFLAITYRSPKGFVFDVRWSILGSIGWTYMVVAIIYLFTRDSLRLLGCVWGVMLLLCALVMPLRPEMGGDDIFGMAEPNFLEGMLKAWHIGSHTLMTLGGVILSVAGVRILSLVNNAGGTNADAGAEAKVNSIGKFALKGLGISLACLSLAIFTRHFWIAAKLGITIPCIFYIYALATCLYTLFTILVRVNLVGWYNLFFRPAGTSTLTTYMLPYVFYGFADLFEVVLPDWLTYPPMALVNCLCFSLLLIFLAGVLERLHIKLKL